jgi:hypothetical protein
MRPVCANFFEKSFTPSLVSPASRSRTRSGDLKDDLRNDKTPFLREKPPVFLNVEGSMRLMFFPRGHVG